MQSSTIRRTPQLGHKIAGSDFEQPQAGPKGGGQDARSNSHGVVTEGTHKCRGCREAQERLAEGDPMLGMAVLATYPQETVFGTATFQVLLERTLDIARQYTAPRRQMGGESRVVLFDNLIQKGLFRPVTLVKTSIPILGRVTMSRLSSLQCCS